MGMLSLWRSSGDCGISRSGSADSRMSQGLTYSYLAKKSLMSQTRSLRSGRCGMGSTVITSACTWRRLVWQARRYLPLTYIAHEPQIEARQQ